MPQAEIVTTAQLLDRIRDAIHERPQLRFLETVCYWHLQEDQKRTLQRVLEAAFPDHDVFVFAGSEWNHESYQAASWNDDTLFILLTKHDYERQVEGISTPTLTENLDTLRAIAHATYETLKNKAILFTWRNQNSTIING